MAGKQWQQWGKNQNKNQGWDAQGKGKAQQPKERGLPTHSNHENAQCWNSCGPAGGEARLLACKPAKLRAESWPPIREVAVPASRVRATSFPTLGAALCR